ncbi:double-stranded RNA-binding protein Staufen homolog isoform X2 [Oppia nitens]|uniref:double-stranded RNA-binding protein Staufen homolog isoform X2 n=1 Tax=Oppia nitens TaxID=1686743 RepID=UPI0023DBD90E|nr:double-stranded RNA-binding protein Staufen homolog isoform X2 [Oppia nitens]
MTDHMNISGDQLLPTTVSSGDSGQQHGSMVESSSVVKSPMCRINELSRFNNMKHEYHLISESGPPHDKIFTVALKLGDSIGEQYVGTGSSIKKAQRSAAIEALDRTSLREPTKRQMCSSSSSTTTWPLTPTVELNVLGMKLGLNATYQVFEPTRVQPTPANAYALGVNVYDYRGMHYQRYHSPRGPYSATLTIGEHQFIGKGRTAQAARHAAAQEALNVIRELAANQESANKLPTNSAENNQTIDDDASVKSPISVVHEMALRRNLSVRFEVISQTGPSHLPVFITQCTVGQTVVNGQGNGKKTSKNNSALLMIEELRKLPDILPPNDSNSDRNNTDRNNHYNRNNSGGGRYSRRHCLTDKRRKKSKKNVNKINGNKCDQKHAINNNNICESNDQNNCSDSSGNDNSNNNNNNNNSVKNGSVKDEKESESMINNGQTVTEESVHPINGLIQWLHLRKEKDPQFRLLSERCLDRRRQEFTIECIVELSKSVNTATTQPPQTVSAIGLGPNKKIAKRNSAEAMLQLLNYSCPTTPPIPCQTFATQHHQQQQQLTQLGQSPPSILKQELSNNTPVSLSNQKKIRQVKFVDDPIGAAVTLPQSKMGRQLVPGLILMPINSDMSFNTNNNKDLTANSKQLPDIGVDTKLTINADMSSKVQSIRKLAKTMMDSFDDKQCDNQLDDRNNHYYYTKQLRSLCQTIGEHYLQLHFSDFPKKHCNPTTQLQECLSIVTITTACTPSPIVSHGSGRTQDEARNQASHQAIQALSCLQLLPTSTTQYS